MGHGSLRKGFLKGVGIDLCDVQRIQKMMDRWGNTFEGRVFTEREIKESHDKASSLAARWAAKEAFSKAIKTGIKDFNFADVEVCSEDSGAPSLQLHGDALRVFEAMGGGELHLSLSHEKNMAVAVVIWVG